MARTALAERIVRNALARVGVRKETPGSSSVHTPVPMGSEDERICKTDMSPPLNNLEATMIDAAFHEPAKPQTSTPIASPKSDDVEKDALTAEGRKHIAADNFAVPPDRYPIHDLNHARNALARSSGKPEEAKVKAAVYRKYPSLKPVAKDAGVEPRRVSTVAVTHGNHMLFGKRRDNGKWTVPGGHAEADEDHHQAGLRELKEETGIEVKPKRLKAIGEVTKKTGAHGGPLHVQPFKVKLKEKPSVSMKADPDGEVHRWRWVDVSNGLPAEIADNLHVPFDENVLLQSAGVGRQGDGEAAEKSDQLDSDDVGAGQPGLMQAYQALVSGIDYELASGGLNNAQALERATANLKADRDYYTDRWADVNGTDSADLLSKIGDPNPGPNGLSLDLASGQARKRGFIGLDLYPYDHGTIVQDLNTGIPFPDGSVTRARLVNAPDVLKSGADVLESELKRVVSPGGTFYYEGPVQIPSLDGFDETPCGDDEDVAKAYGITDGAASPVYRQVFTRQAHPDAATADDAFPRLGVAEYDMLPADAALALDALGDFWSDNTTSGRGNRLYGYPSQGALVEKRVPIAKISPKKQIVYCVVLSPNEVDEDEDYMYPEDIEAAAHKYLLDSRIINDCHGAQAAAAPVESYVNPADCEWSNGPYGPQIVKKGAWVIGIKIFDPDLWSKVENGEYQSVSVGGAGYRDPISIPAPQAA